MRNSAFLKNQFFPKCSFPEKADAAQKYLLQNSSSFLDIFILNSFSEKITVPKSNCRKEVLILKKWLFYRSFASNKKLFWKHNSFEKVTVLKKGEKSSCSKEIAAPKK